MDDGWPLAVRRAVLAAHRLANQSPDVVAVAVVGSWARKTAGPQSDIDLIVLTDDPETLLDSEDWFALFDASAHLVRANSFGALQERRLAVPGGPDIEVGIGRPSWATTCPIDEGTARVAVAGMTIVYDPTGCLRALRAAVRPGVV
ncbi:MAG TPA: nucleotidyltransferase domain-containing protein [Mycobacteriales bacterium]|nr:nucleotidyltransferase domain-containing protein [Mycobacteriales bacterium]